jgi:hypothetical protein
MKKEKIIIVLLTVFIVVILLFIGQKQLNTEVLSIDTKVAIIDGVKDYQTKTLNNDKFVGGITDGGAQLTGYMKGGQIYKIEEHLGLSYGVKTYEYYFDGGELVFVNELEEDFPENSFSGDLIYSETEKVFEGEYYYKDGKLIKSRTEGQRKFEDVGDQTVSQFPNLALQNIQLLSVSK